MRLSRLTDIVAGGPGADIIRSNLVDAKLVFSKRVQGCELIAHEVVGVRGTIEHAVDDAQGPVADTVQGHTQVPREQSMGALRQLESAERDWHGHQEHGLSHERVALITRHETPQRRHLSRRWPRHLGRDELQEPIMFLHSPPGFRRLCRGDIPRLPDSRSAGVSALRLNAHQVGAINNSPLPPDVRVSSLAEFIELISHVEPHLQIGNECIHTMRLRNVNSF